MDIYRQNWSGHHTFNHAQLHQPQSVEEVQEIVAGSRKLKVVGTRHSFNDIADSSEDLISLENLNQVLAIDSEQHTVTVEGGIRYDKLSQELHAAGYALHNLASLPDVSVVGACATATHGSGDSLGNLATAVRGMEIVTANGEVVTFSRNQDGEQFRGTVVSLGGLGVVTKLTLDIMPAYTMQQYLYESLPLAQVIDNFDAIMSSAYSVSLFTDWRGESFTEVWLKYLDSDHRMSALESTFFDATAATRDLHPAPERPAEGCTKQMGVPGPWYDRLPHFEIGYMPKSGAELQTEYFVAREDATKALSALNQLRAEIAPLLVAVEIRTIAADDLWLSTCYGRESVAIHFSWHPKWPDVAKLLFKIEDALAPFEARPHWGKLFTMPPTQVQALYEKLPDFKQLLHIYDPQGKFRNAFIQSTLF